MLFFSELARATLPAHEIANYDNGQLEECCDQIEDSECDYECAHGRAQVLVRVEHAKQAQIGAEAH